MVVLLQLLTSSIVRARTVATAASAARCILAGGKAHLFKNKASPIVYSKAIGHVEGSPEPGAVVDVVDGGGGLIGWGVYNPHSMYRVRLLATSEPELLAHRDVGAVLRHRVRAAAQLRAACGLPSEHTTAYRLVNSEGDRISGLTVDVFGGIAVAVTSALWIEQRRDEVVGALMELPGVSEVVWRRSDGRLQQDGWDEVRRKGETDGAPKHAEAKHAEAAGGAPATVRGDGSAAEEVEVVESGLRYWVAPSRGQKSGYYCDQRENRKLLAEASDRVPAEKDSGGFSISAAAAGAARCVGVDSSAFALELAARNAALNGQEGVCEFVQADVHRFLKGSIDGSGSGSSAAGHGVEDGGVVERPSGKSSGGGVREQYDVVVCDPPKLAPSVRDLPRATRKYRQLNSGAMRATKPGGLLLSCTCSAAMTQSGGFVKMLLEAAQEEGRTLTLLRVSGAAPDHVLHPGAPEGAYLTAVLAHVA